MKDKIITGADVKKYMDDCGIKPNELAKLVNCSRQTAYAWRSKRYANQPIGGKLGEQLSILLKEQEWEKTYRTKLYEFVTERTKSITYWTFLNNTGIKKEFFISPRFRPVDKNERVTFEEMIGKWEHDNNMPRLIFGPSGAGKSTFVRMAAKSLLEEDNGILPIVVPLGLFPLWYNSEGQKENTILGFIEFVFGSLSLEKSSASKAFNKLIKGSAIIFFDGVDEIPIDYHDSFIALVRKDLQNLSTIPKVIITSREMILARYLSFRRICKMYKIELFSEAQIATLANDMFNNDKMSWRFVQYLNESNILFPLSRLPMTLSIMLSAFLTRPRKDAMTEAAILEYFVESALGKYKGGRSLGGHIEKEGNFKYLDSPAKIRDTICQATYELRKRNPTTTIFDENDFFKEVCIVWERTLFVRPESYRDEFNNLQEYLLGIGFIVYVSKKRYDTLTQLQFFSILLLDWLNAVYVAQEENIRTSRFKPFLNEPVLVSTSERKQIVYAFEIMIANYGSSTKTNEMLDRIYKLCTSDTEKIDQLLNARFLFLVDCMQKGIISSFERKREIRIEFRKRFERNNYALVQRDFQERSYILKRGNEYRLSDEEEYINPFDYESLKSELSETEFNDWQRKILEKRFKELGDLPQNYQKIEEFIQDMEWRYNPKLENILLVMQNQQVDYTTWYGQKTLRRQLFAIRFAPLDPSEPTNVEKLLSYLLKEADGYKLKSKVGNIFRDMALDSYWILLDKLSMLKQYYADNNKFTILFNSIEKLHTNYFSVAKNHKYFREKYCNEKNNWDLEELLTDEYAEAHYIIYEFKKIHDSLEKYLIPSIRTKLINELDSYASKFQTWPPGSKNDPTFELLNRIAKLCIILPITSHKQDDRLMLIKILAKLAQLKIKAQQAWNVGPRQLYDYALFGIWSTTEYETIWNPYDYDTTDQQVLSF